MNAASSPILRPLSVYARHHAERDLKMRIALATAIIAAALPAYAANAQSITSEFRGFRVEGNAGWDRFQSEGTRNDKFGYGATVGFDGVLADRIVVGPEASFWRANKWSENCTGGINGGSVCHKSFQEYGVAVRAGFLVTPDLLVFGKGGYVNNEQRKRFDAPPGLYYVNGQIVGPETSYYNHGRTDGYQFGGGVEYSLTGLSLPVPVYVSGQYVYANYADHTRRQRAMLGVGVRFK